MESVETEQEWVGVDEPMSVDRCDARWAEVEEAIEDGDPEEFQWSWGRFVEALGRHFPGKVATLDPDGVTSEGEEHARFRQLLAKMVRAVEEQALTDLLALGDELIPLHATPPV